MWLEEGKQERGYLSGYGIKQISALLRGQSSKEKPPVIVIVFEGLLGAIASLRPLLKILLLGWRCMRAPSKQMVRLPV